MAEAGAIGAMLISSVAADVALEMLGEDDFYLPRFRTLFKVLGELYRQLQSVDELILCAELDQRGLLNSIGGRDEVGRLIVNTPSAAGIEGYCRIILDHAKRRSSMQVVGGMLSGTLTISETAARIEALTIAKGAIETSNLQALENEVKDEIEGRRRVVRFPTWPHLSATQALTPGSLTVLCGSPGVSKSFFAVEPLWRWTEAGERVVALELESGANYHLRRIHAQMSGTSTITNADWCRSNPELVNALFCDYRERLQAMRWVLQSPHPADSPTKDYLVNWIHARCVEGHRILVIDPITMMQTGDKGYVDHQQFVGQARAIIKRYGSSLILVSHPKRGAPGTPITPCLENLPNSSAYERFSDTILWLESIEECTETFTAGTKLVNRYLHCLKTRLAANPGRLAYYFDKKTLRHIECGSLNEIVNVGRAT